jgi:hypothetical protein
MSKITNADHLKLLNWLNNFGVSPSKPRTDSIAKSLNWTNQHMPCVGLELRALGLVESSNDGKQYNFWRITGAGVQRLLAHRLAVRNESKREAPVTLPTPQPRGYIVVSASDSGEQSPIHTNRGDADKLANKWAKEEPGVTYLVCAVLEKVKANIVVFKE